MPTPRYTYLRPISLGWSDLPSREQFILSLYASLLSQHYFASTLFIVVYLALGRSFFLLDLYHTTIPSSNHVGSFSFYHPGGTGLLQHGWLRASGRL